MSTTETSVVVSSSSPSKKKWYEDEEKQTQTQFSRAGVGFDAISAKLQELHEIGVLKLFIETEVLKSNTGAFEPGFKEIYSPYSMTIPQRVGKDLLFTSDVEFSDSGFASGSLENDKKKIFLNRTEFSKYLLRLPKPVSDTETPLDEKRDMNAYKYLQVLGTELQDKILFLCDNFINDYNRQYTQNTNDNSRIQKEINDLKRLTGPGITADDIKKRIAEKDKQLVQVKNIKNQLETKRANYKNACTILSNSTKRSQYNASLVAAYPALKKDASSYSTVMLDWFKYKHNGSNFFKQVCRMFKPVIPKKMLTTRQEILISIKEVATKLGNIFKPIFESYFFNDLTTNVARYMRFIPNNTYASYLFELSNPVTRRNDSSKFSWININAMFSKIIKETQFTNYFDKIELERLQTISNLMANFNSDILTMFSLFKFEKNMNIFTSKSNDNNNIYERAEQDDDFFKHAENINMLFQNVYYLKMILEMIVNKLNGLAGLTPQQSALVTQLQTQLNDIIQKIINVLFPILNVYQINVQRYDYITLLGNASHSEFVENAFSGKIAFISHFHKNNKFLVSSTFIQNTPVTITIPDGNYTLETLSSVVENLLCSNCKWSRQSNYNAEMLWRCKYDNKNFLRLALYFPMNNMNNIPNIRWMNQFRLSSASNAPPVVYTLNIPQGEYKNIRQVLDAMQNVINDFITKPSEFLLRPFQSVFTITLELNPATNTECIKFKLQKKIPTDLNEDLRIELIAPQLAQLFCKNNTLGFVPINIDIFLNNSVNNPAYLQQTNAVGEANSEKILTRPPDELHLSNTITIDTATNIDGEKYDASEIFGIRHQANGSLQLYPDIILNSLYISNHYDKGSRICYNRNYNVNFQSCIFLSTILDSQLELQPNALNSLNDFGILDFTSQRINNELNFAAVNMKEIEKNANNSTTVEIQNGFKSEILEKTGIYMNNRLLNPKVPVITPVDILNSILYRYPCVPSSHVKRILKEGSVEFDDFIQQRVNISDFNDIVCLGKGEKGQTPSLTFKNILKKTLMYDESDERRNKLFCDLHYALCGPVYTDVNPSREINKLTIIDQFSLQNNRPSVISPGTMPTNPPVTDPFIVKGVTPFYDYEKEYYKYLIYGEYMSQTTSGDSYTRGCIKYYDPGEKIGPGHNLNASELYDVIVTLSFQYDNTNSRFILDTNGNRIITSSTISKVIWLPSNREYSVDRFIIIGEFQRIIYINKYEPPYSVIEDQTYGNRGITQYYTTWSFSHTHPTPPPSRVSYFGFNDEIDSTNYRISNVITFDNLESTINDVVNNVIITTNAQEGTVIFIPYLSATKQAIVPNPIPDDIDSSGANVFYKLSCSAVSMNKSLKNILNSYRFYHVMEIKHPNPPIHAYATSKVDEYQGGGTNPGKLRQFTNINPDVINHLLWLGLKEKTQVRKILSCKLINRRRLLAFDLVLPIEFEDGDSIENIRVDVNDPEIVTVFGKFKATISDQGLSERPKKVIQNVMVIYTNLQNAEQNDSSYGTPAYSLGYDNFKGISINEYIEFTSLYSCLDGLVPASIEKGTTQQNIGILTVKKTQTSEPIVIGFHNAVVTSVSEKSSLKEGAIQVPFTLCYDYNMYAKTSKIVYDEFAYPPVPPETKIENSIFNPLTFYTSYNEGGNKSNRFFKGVYALVHAKNPSQLFSSPSNLHVLNTWGIDLSSSETLFFKRLYEQSKTSTVLQFNIKSYEKYMNDIIDTILGSAKAYYEEKIKSTFYTYGVIDGKSPILFKRSDGENQNIVVGGGKEDDAKQMLLATEYVVDEDAEKNNIKGEKNTTHKKNIEIRIPDIMLSDKYVGILTEQNRRNVRMLFVNSIFKYSKHLIDITLKQNEDVQKNKGANNNLVILDDYQIVICSNNETIRNRFNELKALDDYASANFLTLSDDVFNFELPDYSSSQHDKHVILVNEWNDKGFIGDYGAYAYSDADADASTVSNASSVLTPNQMMISKSRQVMTEATALKEAVTKGVPKYPNTAFLLNPVFSYYTLDPSKWTGLNSLIEKSGDLGRQNSRIQLGGARPLYPSSSYGLSDPYFLQNQLRAPLPLSPYNAQLGLGYGYGQQLGYGYGQQLGMVGPQGYGYGDDGDEIVRMKRKVLESTDVPSRSLKKINFQTMQTDTRFKKIVLWLFDSRDNKMLMTKTQIGNKTVLSLPVQNQQVGTIRASGYSLLQQLCRRLFNQADIIRKWTLEVSYSYVYDNDTTSGTGSGTTGIFIYSAKSYDLPKPTLELNYINMQAVLNLTKGAIFIKKGSQQMNESVDIDKGTGNGSQLEINPRDVALIGEVFRVVPLIQGGIISSTSKEFNEIVASLVSKTPHQHLRSSISEKKRRENVEKNIQFLINLFFPQNSLFFVRGQIKYYIYSSQQSCKIFTIVKQPGYDDDSYLTCLKLFLQSEYDYKQKLSTFRVGCSMKKKLIADNFSSVWDSFWNDLIESQEQAAITKQIESEIGSTEMGEEEEQAEQEEQIKEVLKNDRVTAPVCLNGALTTCKKMYNLKEDWNASSYYPLAYNGILYNLEPNEQQYGFNNEYYYNLENIERNRDTFYGFKCMKYNGDSTNPILYLGGKKQSDNDNNVIVSAVYELSLKTKKLKPILVANNENSEILCIDMIGNKHLIIGGKGFDNVVKYIDGRMDDSRYDTTIPLVVMNIETYNITLVYDNNRGINPPIIVDAGDNSNINKLCICKTRKIIDKSQVTSYYEYFGLFGGNIKIETSGANGDANIMNIGSLVIKIPIDDSNPNFQLTARMYCIDKYLENSIGNIVNVILGLTLRELPESQNVNITSIICDEEEEKREDGEDEEKRDTDAGTDGGLKNKTTFYVGGYFNAFSYMDYDELKKAEAAAVPGARVDPNQFIKNGTCNSILKLTITTSYNTVATDYRQQCTFEPVETNANKNNIIFNASLGFNKVASSYYLLAFTAFFDKMEGTLTNINDFKFTTTLNVFDLKTKLNTQVMVPAPKARPTVSKSNYKYQCIAVVQDVRSKNDIVVMSYTTNIGGINGAYSFTCGLKMEAPLRVVESKCNDQAVTSHYNSNSDMCGIENQSGNQIDLYVAHEEIRVAEHNVEQILYPLTVKSNYQEIGNWNLGFVNSEPVSDSSSISNETETFFRFVDSIMELSKIFKEYPSTTLFLQNIDYRDKNEKITNNTLYEMYGDLELKTSVNPNLIRDPKVISIEYSCNEVFLKLNFMLHIWSIMISSSIQFNDLGNEDANNIALFNNIKNFYDSFIFLLIYAGCINLAQSLCKNYSESILSGVNRKEASAIRGEPEILIFTMVKQQFMNAFEAHCFGDTSTNNMFKQFFTEKAPLHDVTFQNIMICSNPSTYSGIAYVSRRLDQNLQMLITETKQKTLQNKIYKSNETFFNSNDEFFTTILASDSINTVDQINFCSFYKFERFQDSQLTTPYTTNFGGMMNTTIYTCVNIDSTKNLESSKVFDFLNVIIAYFKRLPSGAPTIDIGIGGPIQRIIFGGNFGCNLLHHAEVCAQFSKSGMKVYTMPNNSNAFTSNTNDSGNHMFVVDVNLVNSPSTSSPLLVGGHSSGSNNNTRNNDDYDSNKHSSVKRLTIGKPIQVDNGGQNMKLIIVNHKKKTRRRYN